jgi:hypothetical protein
MKVSAPGDHPLEKGGEIHLATALVFMGQESPQREESREQERGKEDRERERESAKASQ